MIDPFAESVAKSIDLINSVRFVAGERHNDEQLADVWTLAQRVPTGIPLRVFQKAGISSASVAVAVRMGVLLVMDATP